MLRRRSRLRQDVQSAHPERGLPPQELQAQGSAAAAQVADRLCTPQAHERPQPRRVGAEGKHAFELAVERAAGPEPIQILFHNSRRPGAYRPGSQCIELTRPKWR